MKSPATSLITTLALSLFSMPVLAGDVPAGKFANPISKENILGLGDPYIMYVGGYYYGTCSYFDVSTVRMFKSKTLGGLFYEPEQTIFRAEPGTNYSNLVWGGEFYYLDGRWYFYFPGSDANIIFKNHVLEGGTDPNNPLCEPYTYKAEMYSPGSAIDSTVIKINGINYFIQAQDFKLTIAKMISPWEIDKSTYTLLSEPEYSWETASGRSLNEGPAALYGPDGKIYLTFSAVPAHNPAYCVGLLTLTGDDPLDRASWTKSPEPVFKATATSFGPGHNNFFKSPDGTEDWISYHVKVSDVDSWDRNLRAQKLSWNADGTPNFGVPVDAGVLLDVPSGQGASNHEK